MIWFILGLACWCVGLFYLLRVIYVCFAEGIYGSVENCEVPFYYAIIAFAFWVLKHPIVWGFVFAAIFMVFL